ncbi:MAG: NfeD family protein [Porphyromonadaceae bacterium]|jgi:membrane-bound ClpP family serine protease|nr:NfeD family protein [uncultured Macellibacteroides sp.]MCE5225461.1 NfeD family protein [Porphyromonadaceae bacterium]
MILDIAIVAFLLVVAIVLLLLEIFLLPGITVAGIGGFLFAAGGVAYAYSKLGLLAGNISLISAGLVFAISFFWLLRSNSFSKVALKKEVDGRLVSSRDLGIEPGDEGITLSRLNPMGKIRVKGITVEAKSFNGFVDENIPVVVVRIDASNVLVKIKE